MPNHVHAVVELNGNSSCGLGEVVRGFKTFAGLRVNNGRGTSGGPVWQRGYWEHIVRTESALGRIREYIRNNPFRWDFDPENPSGQPDKEERSFWASLAPPGQPTAYRSRRAGLKPATYI
jgi:Transposase IS200 like